MWISLWGMESRLTVLCQHALLLSTALQAGACTGATSPPIPRAAPRDLPPGAPSEAGGQGPSGRTEAARGRYYGVHLIWLKDAVGFREYQTAVGPIAARYGVLDRTLVPSALYGDGLSKPDLLTVVHYHDRAGVAGLEADADFRRVVPLRTASIDLVSVGGASTFAELAPEPSGERQYLVELVRFGEGGEAAYARYAARAEAAMGPYGYHVELVLRPEHHSGLAFVPDLVKVAYFDSADGFGAFHRDPAHPDLERSYGEVAAESVWIMGAIRPEEPAPRE